MGSKSKELMNSANLLGKGLAILLAIVLVFGYVGCKKEIPTDVNSSSAIRYKPFGFTEFYDACTEADGNILILGNNAITTKLVKATKDGILIWEKNIPTFKMASPTGHMVSTRPDGSILLFGSHEVNSDKFVFELEIIKLNSSGKTLKTTRYSIKDNKAGFPYPVYSTSPDRFLAADHDGGFYVNLSFSTSYTYSRGWENYILHYNNNDSIDQINDVSTGFSADWYELATGSNGNPNFLIFRPSTAKFLVTQLDEKDFLKGIINKRFETVIEPVSNGLTGVSDEKYMYGVQLKPDTSSNFSEGLYVSKMDLANGSIVSEWLLPLKLDLLQGQFDFQMLNPSADANAVYFTLGLAKDIYIVKSTKEGQFLWSFKIDGNLSRDYALKTLPVQDGLVVLAYGSNNRSKENNLMMLKLDHNGKLFEK